MPIFHPRTQDIFLNDWRWRAAEFSGDDLATYSFFDNNSCGSIGTEYDGLAYPPYNGLFYVTGKYRDRNRYVHINDINALVTKLGLNSMTSRTIQATASGDIYKIPHPNPSVSASEPAHSRSLDGLISRLQGITLDQGLSETITRIDFTSLNRS